MVSNLAIRVVLCGVAICFATLAPGQAATPPGEVAAAPAGTTTEGPDGTPQIRFTKLEHDFGKADSGPDLKATFEFKNVGDDVLVIEKVKGG